MRRPGSAEHSACTWGAWGLGRGARERVSRVGIRAKLDGFTRPQVLVRGEGAKVSAAQRLRVGVLGAGGEFEGRRSCDGECGVAAYRHGRVAQAIILEGMYRTVHLQILHLLQQQ